MEIFQGEFSQILGDRNLLAVSFPALKIGLECGFEVEGHSSKACALEVEVEVHVVFVRRAGVFFQFCDVFQFGFARHVSSLLLLS